MASGGNQSGSKAPKHIHREGASRIAQLLAAAHEPETAEHIPAVSARLSPESQMNALQLLGELARTRELLTSGVLNDGAGFNEPELVSSSSRGSSRLANIPPARSSNAPPAGRASQKPQAVQSGRSENASGSSSQASSKIDTAAIVGRLMQIRDYLRQANDLREQLSSSQPADNRQNYEQLNKITRLIDHLKEQEEGYMSLLTQILGGCYDDVRGDADSVADSVSINLDAQSEVEESVNNGTLLQQQAHLALALAAQQDDDEEEDAERESVGGRTREEELQELRKQHHLLEKLLVQQRQLKQLRSHQQDLEISSGQGSARASLAPAQSSQAAPPQASQVNGADEFLSELLQLRDRVTQMAVSNGTLPPETQNATAARLRNNMGGQRQLVVPPNTANASPPSRQGGGAPQGSAEHATAVSDEMLTGLQAQLREKQALEAKLLELQDRKDKMDQLLRHLHSLRDSGLPAAPQNGDGAHSDEPSGSDEDGAGVNWRELASGGAGDHDPASYNSEHYSPPAERAMGARSLGVGGPPPPPPPAGRVGPGGDTDHGSMEQLPHQPQESDHRTSSEMIAEIMDSEEKMRKLQEYQERLRQLKDLVDVYQNASQTPRQPLVGDAESPQAENYEDRSRSTSTDTQSSQGPPDDDLETRFRDIEAMREGVLRLQEIISKVQGDPQSLTALLGSEDLGMLLRNSASVSDTDDGDEDENLGAVAPPLRSQRPAPPRLNRVNGQPAAPRGAAAAANKTTARKDTDKRPQVSAAPFMNNRMAQTSSGITPSQREVEGSVGSVPGTTGSSMPGPVSNHQLASNKEIWLEMRKQKIQKEEAKNRARGRFGDGQSEESLRSDYLGRSTSATYGGSEATGANNVEKPESAEFGGDFEDYGDEEEMMQAEEEEEQDQDDEVESSSSNDTYTLDEPPPQPSSSRTRTVLMPDNRKTDNRVAASKNASNTRNSWSRNTRQRKQENISAVTDIALDASHNSSTASEGGGGNLRQMYQELKEQLTHTNAYVRTLASRSGVEPPFVTEPPTARAHPAQLQANAQAAPPIAGPASSVEDMFRSMESLMRQQMMLQMTSMYSNMQASWQNPMALQSPFMQPHPGWAAPPGLQPQPNASFPNPAFPHNMVPPVNFGGRGPSSNADLSPYQGCPQPIQYPASHFQQYQQQSNQFFEDASIHSLSTDASLAQSRQQQQFPQSETHQNTPKAPESGAAVRPKTHKQKADSLAKSWPLEKASTSAAGNPPYVPPLGLVSNSPSQSSTGDGFTRTYPNPDHPRGRYFPGQQNRPRDQPRRGSGSNRQLRDRPESVIGLENALLEQVRAAVEAGSSRRPGAPRRNDDVSSSAEAGPDDDDTRAPSVVDGCMADDNSLSLFDALRDSIYSELASVITENESRPHFLIELFRELKMLNTDYLRQRALIVLQDLINKYISEEGAAAAAAAAGGVSSSVTSGRSSHLVGRERTTRDVALQYLAGEEYTPSEQSEASGFDRPTSSSQDKGLNSRRGQDKEQTGGHDLFGQPFDFEQVVNEDDSDFSTPSSPNIGRDSLGETAIYLERVCNENSATGIGESSLRIRAPPHNRSTIAASYAAFGGFESDGSVPDLLAKSPQIDTQQLDIHIKSIMSEIIPQLKSRMDETCSQAFLNNLRKQVLQLASSHYDGAEEFVRFFHQQLSAILNEAFNKFVGRTLRDCGEDLLVEVSEVLFNELAFFRMMRNLDGGTGDLSVDGEETAEEDGDDDDESVQDSEEGNGETDRASSSVSADIFNRDLEAEAMCNERDDALAATAPPADEDCNNSDGGEESNSVPVLSMSEARALISYGSGEDDDEEEVCSVDEQDAGDDQNQPTAVLQDEMTAGVQLTEETADDLPTETTHEGVRDGGDEGAATELVGEILDTIERETAGRELAGQHDEIPRDVVDF